MYECLNTIKIARELNNGKNLDLTGWMKVGKNEPKSLKWSETKKNGKKISVSFYQTKQIQELCISQELDIQIT